MLFVAAPWAMSWRTVCLPWGVWCSRRVFAILRPAAWSAWASTRAVSLLAFMDSAMVRLETSSSTSYIPPFPGAPWDKVSPSAAVLWARRVSGGPGP